MNRSIFVALVVFFIGMTAHAEPRFVGKALQFIIDHNDPHSRWFVELCEFDPSVNDQKAITQNHDEALEKCEPIYGYDKEINLKTFQDRRMAITQYLHETRKTKKLSWDIKYAAPVYGILSAMDTYWDEESWGGPFNYLSRAALDHNRGGQSKSRQNIYEGNGVEKVAMLYTGHSHRRDKNGDIIYSPRRLRNFDEYIENLDFYLFGDVSEVVRRWNWKCIDRRYCRSMKSTK